MKTARCAPTTSAFFLGVACLTLALSSCENAKTGPTDPTGPPAPPRSGPVPNIGGTWTGTMKSGNRPTRPITIAIDQPAGGRSVTGTLKTTNCSQGCKEWELSIHINAVLEEASPWKIQGSANYQQIFSYPYLNYSAPLNGTLEGSPVSQISATTSDFRSTHGGVQGTEALRLEVARSAP